MSAISTRPDQIELYLMHLNAALLDIPRRDRDDFLQEIRTHIFERLQQDGAEVDAVLKALGDPEELAYQFHSECSLAKSSHSWSPWVLMRTAARWGLNGVQGFVIFLVAFIGYTFAACFYITAALKPIFPSNIGFFISKQGLNLASWPTPRGHEVLGPYYTMTALVLGFLFVVVTSFVLRMMMRNFSKVRSRLA
jgi:uncharacterized membrane protein